MEQPWHKGKDKGTHYNLWQSNRYHTCSNTKKSILCSYDKSFIQATWKGQRKTAHPKWFWWGVDKKKENLVISPSCLAQRQKFRNKLVLAGRHEWKIKNILTSSVLNWFHWTDCLSQQWHHVLQLFQSQLLSDRPRVWRFIQADEVWN